MPSLSGSFQAEFCDLTRLLVEEVAADDLPPQRRERLAHLLTQAFVSQWAGCNLYIPQHLALEPAADIASCRERRDAMIRAECDGSALSVHRAARRYGLSEISIWRVLKRDTTGVSRTEPLGEAG